MVIPRHSPPPFQTQVMTPPLPNWNTPNSIRNRHLNSPRPGTPIASGVTPRSLILPESPASRYSESRFQSSSPSSPASRSLHSDHRLLPAIPLDSKSPTPPRPHRSNKRDKCIRNHPQGESIVGNEPYTSPSLPLEDSDISWNDSVDLKSTASPPRHLPTADATEGCVLGKRPDPDRQVLFGGGVQVPDYDLDQTPITQLKMRSTHLIRSPPHVRIQLERYSQLSQTVTRTLGSAAEVLHSRLDSLGISPTGRTNGKEESRESVHLRLDALRDLVADLDLDQHWSRSETESSIVSPIDRGEIPTIDGPWHSDFDQGVSDQLDSQNVQRAEILREMYETERTFIQSTRTVLRLFAAPLKMPRGEWISGIPAEITQLFDHLEDICSSHAVLAAAMLNAEESLDLVRMIESFRAWIPSLKGHEWYLVNLESVIALIEESARNEENVFGEFVRMQTKAKDMGAMTLSSMLLKPVQRLMQYTLFWKRVLQVTFTKHPQHSDLVRILSETEDTILALQSAKAKEEDFQELVNLERRLVFENDIKLAVRGRKMLGQGIVIRVQGKELAPITLARASSLSSRGSVSSVSSFWDTRNSMLSSQSGCSRSGSMKGSPRLSLPRSPSSTSIVEGAARIRRNRDEMQLFVFNDLVILATAREGLFKSSKRERMWKVEADGVGNLVEATDWSGWAGEPSQYNELIPGHATLFTLTITSIITTTTCLSIPTSPKSKCSFSCPFLISLPQFLATLAQAAGDDHSVEDHRDPTGQAK